MRVAAFALLLATTSGCAVFGSETVTRKVHGKLEDGRFVSQTAYLAYARGALAESAHQLDVAERDYLEAARADGASADVWTRVGAVRCAEHEAAASAAAFARAESIDSTYAPLWSERATCAMANGDLASARQNALRSLALDPSHDETTLLLATIERRDGKPDEARRWLRGLAARSGSVGSSRALVALKEDTTAMSAEDPKTAALRRLDDAIVANRTREARRRASEARLSPSALSLRALALGNATLAKEEAALVVAADPTDADARIALLVAADALGDSIAETRALSDLPAHSTTPSPLATALLSSLLARRGFSEASIGIAPAPSEGPTDPLLDRALHAPR
jgi:Tfp pilus assembly protein PilF